MKSPLTRQTFWLIGSIVICAVSARQPSAQEVAPPPLPDRALLNGTENEIPVPVEQSDIEAEVLTRGPVHEAFAEQYVADPRPTPIVEMPPPEAIDEVPPEDLPEGANVEWVPGYWSFDEEVKDFIWISGLWRDLPPGQQWVPGYWGEVEGGWQWVPGFWSSADSEELSYLPEPPESLEQGPNVEAPSPEYFWTPGTWIYQTNRYFWQPGCWARPYNDYLWVPSRYQWTPRGYVFCSGYWDYPVFRRGVLFSPVRFRNRLHRHRYYGYRYRPRVAVAAGPLLVHLFVRPRTRHYYFGDYYANHYRSRGIFHLTRYNTHSHRRHSYDPFCSYYRVASRRTTYNRLVDWHHYYDRHESSRPAHTYRQTRDRSGRVGPGRNAIVAQQSTLSQPLSEMIAKTRTSKSKYGIQSFRHIQERDRDQLSNRAKSAVHDLRTQRVAFETRRGIETVGNRNKNTESRPGQLDAGGRNGDARGIGVLGEKGELASMKLPENSVLRAKLDKSRTRTELLRNGRTSLEDRRNSQQDSIDVKKGLDHRTVRNRESDSRSQLESLRERIEASRKSRSDRDSITKRESRDLSNEKSGQAKTTRNDPGSDVRSRIEAARKSSGKNTSDLKMRIEAAKRDAEKRQQPTIGSRTKTTQSSSTGQSDLRARIEAARKASSRSATSRTERSGKLSSQEPVKSTKSPSIDRGTKSLNSSSDLNARIEAARRASASRQRTTTGKDPKTPRSAATSQSDTRARIEAARKASAERRESRSDDRSSRSTSRSTTTIPKASESRSRVPKTSSPQSLKAPTRSSRTGSSTSRSSSSRQAIQDAAKRVRSSSTPSRTSSSRSSSTRSSSSRSSTPRASSTRPSSSSTRSSPPSRSSSSRSSNSGSRSRSTSSSSSSRPSRAPRSSRSRDKK